MVLLEISRDQHAFDAALLGSPPAASALALGVDVQPGWGHGAKIFVPEIGPEQILEAYIQLLPQQPFSACANTGTVATAQSIKTRSGVEVPLRKASRPISSQAARGNCFSGL